MELLNNLPRGVLVSAIAISCTLIVHAAQPQTVRLAVPGRASANASITASGEFVAVTWGATSEDGKTDVYAAVSRDGGRTFSAPVRASGSVAPAQVSGEQPPRIALVSRASGEPAVVIVWTAKSSKGTTLVMTRSDNGGRTYGALQTVPGSAAPGNRGWESIATTRDGHVVALWLDHREQAESPSSGHAMRHAEHVHAGHDAGSTDGFAKAQRSRLYFARVDDPSSVAGLAGGVCYCCKTALAVAADGALYAAWRHVYPGNVRDVAFSMSRDGRTFSKPVRVSDDNWVLDGCPENGPAIVPGAGARIHIVWPTLVPSTTRGSEPTLGLFYAQSEDGLRFTSRVRMPTDGTPSHVQIARSVKGSLVVIWVEGSGGRRRVVAARGDGDGAGPVHFTRELIAGAESAVYPVVAPVGDAFIVGWTDRSRPTSAITIERLP